MEKLSLIEKIKNLKGIHKYNLGLAVVMIVLGIILAFSGDNSLTPIEEMRQQVNERCINADEIILPDPEKMKFQVKFDPHPLSEKETCTLKILEVYE